MYSVWFKGVHKLTEALYQVCFEAGCAQSLFLKSLTQLSDPVPRQSCPRQVAARLQLPPNAELMLANL